MDALFDLVRKQLENQFLTGGLVLVVFTGILALLRNVPDHLGTWLKRQFVTTIDVSDHDPAFFWIQKWLGEHPYTKKSSRLLTVSTRTVPYSANQNHRVIEGSSPGRKRDLPEVVFSPAPGRHLLRFQGRFLLLTRERSKGDGMISGELAYHESFTFHAFSRDIVQKLIYAAREIAFPPQEQRVAIWRPQAYSGWRVVQQRMPRPMESVILDDDTDKNLIQDLQWFFGASAWYAQQGIPYQRGYLLHGRPGNGKTSLVVALASIFDRDIYILSIAGLNDTVLSGLMGDLPEHALVLIEDIDRAFHARERTQDANKELTFSGFLNAIDGVSAPIGRVLFMTTNHPEHLDEALVRRGRADRQFELKDATPDMARRLYLRFFPAQIEMSLEFERRVGLSLKSFSMADLQEHLIQHRDHPEAAVYELPRTHPVAVAEA